MNSKSQYRRLQSNLSAAGTGVILFGIWDTFQSLTYTFFNTVDSFALPYDFPWENTVFLVLMLMLNIIFLYIYIYIGRSAVREAHHGFRNNRYVRITLALIIIDILAELIVRIWEIVSSEMTLYSVISLIIDISTITIMCQMVGSVRKLRHFRKISGK